MANKQLFSTIQDFQTKVVYNLRVGSKQIIVHVIINFILHDIFAFTEIKTSKDTFPFEIPPNTNIIYNNDDIQKYIKCYSIDERSAI